MSGELGRDIRDRGIVLAGDDEFDVTLSIVVDEPIADVRIACSSCCCESDLCDFGT